MKIIHVNTVEIKVNDEQVIKMMECVTVDTNQEILIRNKKDTLKLSKQIVESSEQMRKQRYLDALSSNDRLYLNSIYESLSVKDIFKLLITKAQQHF